MAKIQGNEIIFADHKVVMDRGDDWSQEFVDEYLQEIASDLKENGSMEDHIRQLDSWNNDGTWSVQPL